MTFKIVSDSASNVFNMENINFSCVPLKIVCGEKEYVDTLDLDLDGMIEDLKRTTNTSSTSCPNVYEWLEAFRGADRIFAVAITGSLSGSYSAAVRAKELYEEENKDVKVCVINTLSAGPEMQLIIERLRELIESGSEFDEIANKIKLYSTKTHLLFCLQSLKNLARNGRVSPAKAKIAEVLGIRVVGKASDEGTLQQLHKIRGEEKSILGIYKEMLNQKFNGGKVRIAHCQNLNAAERLKEIIISHFPKCNATIQNCAALCTYYAEQGGLLIGFESI